MLVLSCWLRRDSNAFFFVCCVIGFRHAILKKILFLKDMLNLRHYNPPNMILLDVLLNLLLVILECFAEYCFCQLRCPAQLQCKLLTLLEKGLLVQLLLVV